MADKKKQQDQNQEEKQQEQQSSGQQDKKQQNKKAEVQRYIYVGPTITELLLVFGKVYKEIPKKIPEELKDLKIESFFVDIKDYPKKKVELKGEREKLSKKYRAMLKQKREKAKGGNR